MSNFFQFSKTPSYKVQLSKIRYQYQKDKTINASIVRCVSGNKCLDTAIYHVPSGLLIDSLQYLVDITQLWDARSGRINGWKSAGLTIFIAQKMLTSQKYKYEYNPTDIKFSGVWSMYAIAEIKNDYIDPLNNVLYGVWVASAQNKNTSDLSTLIAIIEGLSKSQLLYHIPNYPFRGTRPYKLPWEVPGDPVVEYRMKFGKESLSQRERVNVHEQTLLKQTDIRQFFQPIPREQLFDNSDAPCSKDAVHHLPTDAPLAANEGIIETTHDTSIPTDAEAVEILEYLLHGNAEEEQWEEEQWQEEAKAADEDADIIVSKYQGRMRRRWSL